MFSSFISQFLNSCMCVHVDYCNSCVCMHYGKENIVCTSPASQYSNVVLIVLYSCFQLLIVCPVCTVWGWQECCFILLISSVCLVVDIILFSVDPNILHTYSLAFLKIFFITSPDAECIMRFIACLWSGLLSTELSRAVSAAPATSPPQPSPGWSNRHRLVCNIQHGSH